MNQQARLLGATNTHFVNPNGLPAADHYSTARDLATMFAHAMRDPLFEHIVNTKTETVRPVAGSARRIALRNHNRLLGNYRIHVVGKTGWTIAAKKCFVGAARQNGREVVVAVMGSRDLWGDLKRLLEFALEGAPMPALEADEIQSAAAPSVWAGVGDSEDTEARPPAPTYSVHLGAFRYLRSAARLKNTVVHKGYRARIETVRVGRERRYRVAVGNYADRRAAEQAAASLKKAHRHLLPVVAAGS
jgi:D-alanyl-D-alanine carboxypeptidase